jgi:peptidyl-dipeptidase Dcp
MSRIPSSRRARIRRSSWLLLAGTGLALGAAAGEPGDPAAYQGPFAQPSPLFLQIPAFDRYREADFREGMLAGMAQQRAAAARIAADPQPPGFENTIVALERSGLVLARASTVFANLTSANTNPEHDAIDAEMSPKLAAHQDAIFLDPALFARVQAVYAQRAQLGLDPESLRLLERYHTLFRRAGAALGEADKARLRAINEELSSTATAYDQALLKANAEGAVVVERREALAGLDEAQIAAAAAAAAERHLEGKWLFALERPTGQGVLAALEDRALRERIYRAAVRRGDGGAQDTRGLIVREARLRAQKAALLGYPNWAAYALADETAGTAQAVNRMLAQLAPAAIANARKDAAALQQLIDEDCARRHRPSFRLQAWDWAYYAERLRQRRYHFDEAQVRPYFELDQVLHEGLFWAAHELYGLSFVERKDLPVYQADVRVFEVREAGGATLALMLFDGFERPNKQGGAWMNEYVSQSRLLGQQPVVAIHLNMARPPAGQPMLMSFDDVNGLFHEFGHALHGMFSSVQYPLFAGTATPSDFVEYPSQFNEMWSRDARVLAHMARHAQTGAPMPLELLDQVLAAQRFGQSFATSEYLAAAILDQGWHQVDAAHVPAPAEVARFEARILARAGVDFAPVPPRYHSTYFSHVFGGTSGGYSAAYYAYIWSDVLAKDTEQWMKDHGGLQRANGEFLRAKVLARGFSADPAQIFREFYGREPEVQPLLEARGLAPARAAPAAGNSR